MDLLVLVETMARLVNPDLQDLLVQEEDVDLLGHPEKLALVVKLVNQAMLDEMAVLDQLVLLDLLVKQESPDQLVKLDLEEQLVKGDNLETQEKGEKEAQLDLLVQLDLSDLLALLVCIV